MMKVKLANVRSAFPNYFVATKVNGEGEAAFSGAFIMTPGHPGIKIMQDAIDAVGKDKWADKWPAIKKAMEATDKTALHNGDSKSTYDGFPGNFFVSSRSKVRPLAINRDRSPLTAEDGVLYSGCFVNANIELWAQDNKFGKRINAQLRGVQYFGPGDAFTGGGQPADADDFDDLGNQGEDDPTA